jgi:hypothetical protein
MIVSATWQEIRVRSGRDDKVEGGGPPWHGWSGMDNSSGLDDDLFLLKLLERLLPASAEGFVELHQALVLVASGLGES